jgi:hypothetical protein
MRYELRQTKVMVARSKHLLPIRVLRLISDDSSVGLRNSTFNFALRKSDAAYDFFEVAQKVHKGEGLRATSVTCAAVPLQTVTVVGNKNSTFPVRNWSHLESDHSYVRFV